MHSARHIIIIKHMSNPHFLTNILSYDVASTRHQ